MGLFKKFKLPPLAYPADQLKWVVESTIGGAAQPSFDLPVEAIDFDFPQPGMAEVDNETTVHIELVAVDKSFNRSTPQVFDYTGSDTFPPPQPGPMAIIGGRQDALKYFTTIALPPVHSSQSSWRASVVLDSQPQGSFDIPLNQTSFEVPQANIESRVGAPVQVQLSAVDAAGNASAPSVLDYVVSDTYPPPQPAPLTVIDEWEA